jgi:NAD(P)H-nitrite reductase large subunit
MRIVVVGNSAAGTAAIEAIRQHDARSSIVQLSDETFPLYSRCLLSYYLAGTIGRDSLRYREPDFHRKMQVTLQAGPEFRALKLNARRQEVECANGIRIEYDRLLVCTGSSAKLPSHLPGNIEGIHVLRTFADAEKIRERSRSARSAVVLGAGLIGIKAATALSAAGIPTAVVARSNRVLSQMIDAEASRIVTKQLLEKNVSVLLGTDIAEVQSSGGKLRAVRTEDGRRIECEVLIAAKGVSPNMEWVDPAAVGRRSGILADSCMRTSQENIFAAGDVAEAFDIVLEEHSVNALWTCAVEQGRVAGLNIAGISTAYNGAVGMNSLNVCDISLISFGITAPEDESRFRIRAVSRPDKNQYRKFVIGSDHRIKGIILVGKIENAGVFLSLIQRRIDVSPFEEELLSERFQFGTLLRYRGESGLKEYFRDFASSSLGVK